MPRFILFRLSVLFLMMSVLNLPIGVNAADEYVIAHRSNDKYCIDLNANSAFNGGRIQLWECNGTTAQRWVNTDTVTIRNTQGEWVLSYKIRLARDPRFCLDYNDYSSSIPKSSTRLVLWECNTATRWHDHFDGTFTAGGSNNYTSNLAWDLKANQIFDGNLIWLWEDNDTPAQNWVIRG